MSLLECSQLECGALGFERKTGLQQAPGAGIASSVPSISSGLSDTSAMLLFSLCGPG